MKITRRSRFATVLVALASMLFIQLAVAAYACASLQSAPVGAPDAAMLADCSQAMARGDMMDPAQPNLCHTHCFADQSIDNAQLTDLPSMLSTRFLLVPLDFQVAKRSGTLARPTPVLTRALGPPLAIRNCCFRI